MASASGEIWRITSASASSSLDLHLWNAKQGRDMLFQVLAIDGIAVDTNGDIMPSDITTESGAKIKAVPAPAPVVPDGKTTAADLHPIDPDDAKFAGRALGRRP